MWNVMELAEDADLLMAQIESFSFQAGLIDSRLALSLLRLQGTMEAVLSEVVEIVREQDLTWE
jgi:hypothetical protein